MNAIRCRLTHGPLSLSVCKRDSGLRRGSHSATNTETNPRALNADNKDGELRCEKVRRPAATSESQTSVLSLLLIAGLLLPPTFGQANDLHQTRAEFERPMYVLLDRSEEDWSFLKDPELRTDPWDPLKYIALRNAPGWYLTLAGEERSFYEHYRNYNWGAGPQDGNGYYLNRFLGSADFQQIRSLLLSQTGFSRYQANKEPSIGRFYAHRRAGQHHLARGACSIHISLHQERVWCGRSSRPA